MKRKGDVGSRAKCAYPGCNEVFHKATRNQIYCDKHSPAVRRIKTLGNKKWNLDA